jgi:hypothetical protein
VRFWAKNINLLVAPNKEEGWTGYMLLLILQMMSLLFFLIVNGELLRFFALRRVRLFSDLNLLQICILDVYLGGLILYVIAMIPMGFFSQYTVIGLTAASILISIVIHFRDLNRFRGKEKIKELFRARKGKTYEYLAVFTMFIIFLIINLTSSSAYVFGSVRDESIHSLSVEVILENHQVPLTLQPYLEEGIIYPQASHVIFAFAFYMLNMEVAKVVFYITILFKALSVPGAYFLGKALGSGRAYSLGLSFVFAIMSNWPLSIVWGGNPFLVGFPLFLVCLGLFFSMFCFRRKNSFAELIAVGLFFGYLSATIFSYLQTLIMVAFLVFTYYLVRKHSGMYHTLLEFVVIFGMSLLPLSPFLFRFFAFYPYPGHNIGIPYDFTGWTPQQLYITQALQWAFENLSPYVLLRVITILLLVSFAVLLWKTKNYENVKSVVAFALAIFVAAALLSFISFFLSADFGVISWGHQGIILSVSINILIMALYVKLAEFCRKCKVKRLSKIFSKGYYATILLTITLLSLVTAPFLYYRFLVDPEGLRGGYSMFAVTTQNDYDLMMWMKDNLTSNAVVLVHPYDSGLFIPVVSHHRIVFPWGGSSLSSSYQTLVSLLENNTLGTTTYQLMQHWNISHVFVGTRVVYWVFGNLGWNSELFLGNPNFKLVKNFGDAYLFKLEEYDPDIVFLDDFEYTIWSRNGWQSDSFGNGLGNVTVTTDSGYNGSRCLRITAQSVPKVQEWELKYAYWISRKIFVLNNSDVTLSFYLDATEGFSGNDTFAVLISDFEHGQSIVITTPNGVYDGAASAITTDRRQGLFSYNLTRKWQQLFNSSLPRSFVLQLVNYDFDGIKNVAYIDNIEVISRPVD